MATTKTYFCGYCNKPKQIVWDPKFPRELCCVGYKDQSEWLTQPRPTDEGCDPALVSLDLGGHRYTVRRNKRIKWAELWTILRDGKAFATVQRKGAVWWATTSTTGLSHTMWTGGRYLMLGDKIADLHQANETVMSKLHFA